MMKSMQRSMTTMSMSWIKNIPRQTKKPRKCGAFLFDESALFIFFVVFMREYPHDVVVMPDTIDESRLPFCSFVRKAASGITTDGAVIKSQNP